MGQKIGRWLEPLRGAAPCPGNRPLLLLLLPLLCISLRGASFQAGVARVSITPPVPFWLTGYAARTKPAESVRSELFAKALALRDSQGGRFVLVTTDLIGLPREVSDAVAERLQREEDLPRAQLVLNASHTHAGPVIWPNLRVMFDLMPEEEQRVLAYSRKLTDDLVMVARQALGRLQPAQLDYGVGSASFAINRRQPTASGVHIGVNTNGPVDHTVPVLRVASNDGSLRVLLFGYACHNTTLGGDFYQVDGDYAGAAQRALEQAHPGVTALFLMLCGGDQNPSPRGNTNHVQQHGAELAAAVERALAGRLRRVRPPLRAARESILLDFAPHTRETFEAERKDGSVFRQRRARLMLAEYDAGKPIRQLPYDVQVVHFGRDLTLLALGGEVVVDYPIRARLDYPKEHWIVAGYCGDVSCYIPSLRVLREGGYEAVDSMIYYGQPGPFAENVEEQIWAAVRRTMRATTR